jgi:hypothetical protein
MLGYFLLFQSADYSYRPMMNPRDRIPLDPFHSAILVPRLVSQTWQASLGSFFGEFQYIRCDRGFAMVAFAIAAGAALVAYRSTDPRGATQRKALLPLFAAMTAGLGPGVLMTRIGGPASFDSRYWLPILPYAAAFVVCTLGIAVGDGRRHWATATVAFVVTFASVNDAAVTLRDAQWCRRWSDELRPHVRADELTVCALTNYPAFATKYSDAVYSIRPAAWEITARLSAALDPQAVGKFWAFVEEGPPPKYEGVMFDLYATRSALNIRVRGVRRQGAPDRVIVMTPDENGGIERLVVNDQVVVD